MNKYILIFLVLISICFGAELPNEINVAKFEFGANTNSKQAIDEENNSGEGINTLVVNFAMETEIDKVSLKVAPSKGKVLLKTTKNNKTIILGEIELTGNEDELSLPLDKAELNGVIIEWIPADGKSQLVVKDVGAFTSNTQNISSYVQDIKPFVAKNVAPESQIINVDVAGVSTSPTISPTSNFSTTNQVFEVPYTRPVSL